MTNMFNEEPEQKTVVGQVAASRDSPGGSRMSPIVEKFR